MPFVIALSIVASWFLPALATAAQAQERDTFALSSVPYVHILKPHEDASLIRLTDDDFLDRSGKVVFRVNRYDRFTDDQLLRQLEQQVLPIINRDSMKLVRLAVRGASSPEGPYAFNRELSYKRAHTLTIFLRARMQVPVQDSIFTIQHVAEDYDLLVALMHRANDPDVQVVENLVRHHTPKQQYTLLKKRLQRLQHGKLWKRLWYQYFPELRAAHLILFFEKPDKKVVQLPVPERRLEAPAAELPTFQLGSETLRLPRRELLSVKTNLLLDFAYVPGYNRWCPIPNIGLEYYPLHGHMTYGLSVDFPWWQHYWEHKYFELRNYQLEARYYLRSGDVRQNPPGEGPAFRGFYLQGYVHGGLFLFCFNADKGWTGEYLGGGLGFGYVMPLGKSSRWRLEFGAQVGVIVSQYDKFQYEYRGNTKLQDHQYYYDWTLPAHQFKKRQYRYTWIGPTRIGITLSYDLLFRRRAKKGVSFHSYEAIERRYER